MKTRSYFHLKKGSQFEVKELFKDFSRKIKEHFGGKTENLSVLDIGCASGELLYFLKKDLRTSGQLRGFDISEELIKNAAERFAASTGIDPAPEATGLPAVGMASVRGSAPGASRNDLPEFQDATGLPLELHFFVDDAADFKLDAKFDVITMSSVLSYFDDPYPVLTNALNHLAKGGLALVSGIFNDYNIDVRVRYKLPDEGGWDKTAVINQFSKKSISQFLEKAGYRHKFSTQVMPFDIEPKEHPIRSWTVNVDGRRFLYNGLQLLYNIQILEITNGDSQSINRKTL